MYIARMISLWLRDLNHQVLTYADTLPTFSGPTASLEHGGLKKHLNSALRIMKSPTLAGNGCYLPNWKESQCSSFSISQLFINLIIGWMRKPMSLSNTACIIWPRGSWVKQTNSQGKLSTSMGRFWWTLPERFFQIMLERRQSRCAATGGWLSLPSPVQPIPQPPHWTPWWTCCSCAWLLAWAQGHLDIYAAYGWEAQVGEYCGSIVSYDTRAVQHPFHDGCGDSVLTSQAGPTQSHNRRQSRARTTVTLASAPLAMGVKANFIPGNAMASFLEKMWTVLTQLEKQNNLHQGLGHRQWFPCLMDMTTLADLHVKYGKENHKN